MLLLKKIKMKEEIDLESKKFLSDANNNVTDEIEVSIPSKKQDVFVGLTKDQVLKYGSSPAWVRARWLIFVLFWVSVIGMVLASILFVVFTPKCARVEKLPWYQKDAVYQIDVQNFRDSNGDGVGDLNGVAEKLPYLNSLGIKTIYLSNILDEDKKLDSRFGDENALKTLKKKLESEDMHIMIDVPANILDAALLEDLLKNKVDGVMISNINDLQVGDKKLADVFNALKETAEEISRKTFKPKFLGVKTSDLTKAEDFKKADLVLVDEKEPESIQASTLREKLNATDSEENLPKWRTFSTGSIASRPKSDGSQDENKKRMLKNGIILFLRGTPFIKYGDELHYDEDSGEIMKWDESKPSCGFSKNKTLSNCIPNVLEENSHGSDLTTLKFVRKLLQIRSASNSQSFQWGSIKFADAGDKPLVAFSREATGFDGFVIVANLGDSSVRYDYESSLEVPFDGEVVYYNAESTELAEGKTVHNHNILVKPYGFLVIKYNRNPKPEEAKASSGVGH